MDARAAGWPPDSAAERNATIARLNAEIALIEDRGPMLDAPQRPASHAGAVAERGRKLAFGIPEIDAALDSGLRPGALHEVRTSTALDLAAGAGFALALAGLLTDFCRPVFWISVAPARAEAGAFYGPGLQAIGLDPALLVRIAARSTAEAIWTAGEVAAAPGAGLCLLELCGNPAIADLAFSRRLALRSRAANVPVLLLRQSGEAEASAALTRWRIRPACSRATRTQWLGPPAWHAVLEKCRDGKPGAWTLEWNGNERRFALCPNLGTGSRLSGDPTRTARAALPGGQPATTGDRSDRTPALGPGMAFGRAS